MRSMSGWQRGKTRFNYDDERADGSHTKLTKNPLSDFVRLVSFGCFVPGVNRGTRIRPRQFSMNFCTNSAHA
jgi:hypothetical protein